jgi:hypothetical protein
MRVVSSKEVMMCAFALSFVGSEFDKLTTAYAAPV